MARITYNEPTSGVSLPWVGDELSREHILAGGFMLHAADFSVNPVGSGRKYVESGTLVGRTVAERDAGRGFGPYSAGDSTATPAVPADDEVYLVLYDVWDAADDPETALYRHGSLVYEDKLPVGVDLAVVRANYETLGG